MVAFLNLQPALFHDSRQPFVFHFFEVGVQGCQKLQVDEVVKMSFDKPVEVLKNLNIVLNFATKTIFPCKVN